MKNPYSFLYDFENWWTYEMIFCTPWPERMDLVMKLFGDKGADEKQMEWMGSKRREEP